MEYIIYYGFFFFILIPIHPFIFIISLILGHKNMWNYSYTLIFLCIINSLKMLTQIGLHLLREIESKEDKKGMEVVDEMERQQM